MPVISSPVLKTLLSDLAAPGSWLILLIGNNDLRGHRLLGVPEEEDLSILLIGVLRGWGDSLPSESPLSSFPAAFAVRAFFVQIWLLPGGILSYNARSGHI